MRKADYAALAAIIKAERAYWFALNGTDTEREQAHGAQIALRILALEFADRAHVNRAEFLKACGIE